MKAKRAKNLKKTLNFYKINYHFREPYQILVDGTFCFTALKNQVNISDNIPRYLQGKINLLTTQCSIIEVESLGKKVGGALHILKQYKIHKCGHEGKPVSTTRCFSSMVRNNCNSTHYIIATQDREFQEKIRNLPGVPLLYLHIKTPILENPSPVSVERVKNKSCSISEDQKKQLDTLKFNLKINETFNFKHKKGKNSKFNPPPLKEKKKPQDKGASTLSSPAGIKKKKRKRIRIPEHVKEEILKSTKV